MASGSLQMGVARSLGISSLLFLAVALLLSSPVLYTLLFSLTVVACGRWAAQRVDATWTEQKLKVSWRAQRPAFAGAPTRPRPAAGAAPPQPWGGALGSENAGVAWRHALGAPLVAKELDALLSHVVEEFVSELWYKSLTPDASFPVHVKDLAGTFLAAFAPRLRALNAGALLIRDTCEVLTEQLDLYRRVRERCVHRVLRPLAPARAPLTPRHSIGEETLDRLSPEARERAYAAEMAADGDLLPAASSVESEHAALRRVTDALLNYTLPAAESPLIRSLARELVAGCVLRPVLGFAAPFWLNKLLLAALKSSQGDGAAAAGDAAAGASEELLHLCTDGHGLWDGAAAHEPRPAPRAHDASASAALSVDGVDSDDEPQVQAVRRLDGPDLASSFAVARDGVDEPAPLLAPPGPVRPLRAGLLTARVTGSSVVGDSFSTHVAYELLVADGLGARWLVHRRFSNFEALHKRLKALRARGRHKLPPKRILFHSPEGNFMDARKQLLDSYLQDILADARLCASPEVWDFLSSHSRSYVPAPGGGGVLKSVSLGLSAGLDSAVTAVQRELADAGRKLDRLKERREHRPHAAAAHSAVPEEAQPEAEEQGRDERQCGGGEPTGDTDVQQGAPPAVLRRAKSAESLSLSRHDSSEDVESLANSLSYDHDPRPAAQQEQQQQQQQQQHAGHTQPPHAHREGDDPSGLSMPLLDLVDAVFRLRQRGLVRRRMLSFARALAELFVGGALDEALAGQLQQLRSEAGVAALVGAVRESLWPGGVWHRVQAAEQAAREGRPAPVSAPLGFGGVPPGREEEALREAKELRTLLLEKGGAGAAERLVGRTAYRRGCLELFAMLQSPLFARQLGHTLLEAALAQLFPEMHATLLHVRNGGAVRDLETL